MKTLKTILCAVALTAVVVASKAQFVVASKGNFVMSATGIADIQKAFTIGSNTATTVTMSFNNRFLYTIISNAVANVTNWAGTAIAPTNLPANGYIAYNPTASDGMGWSTGIFYVTNKSGLYYPLSGVDTNNNYYSWIELDSQNLFAQPDAPWPPLLSVRFFLGWDADEPLHGTASYKLNSKTNGVETAKSTAVFYIHDDPYSYNAAQSSNIVFSNDNAVEVRGILKVTEVMTSIDTKISSLSITGSGNLIYAPSSANHWGNLVETATVKFVR